MLVILKKKKIIKYNSLLVLLIDQIHYDFYHYVFLFRLALGNHQGQGYKGVISQTL